MNIPYELNITDIVNVHAFDTSSPTKYVTGRAKTI